MIIFAGLLLKCCGHQIKIVQGLLELAIAEIGIVKNKRMVVPKRRD